MGIPSPYLTMVFPNEMPRHAEYLSLDGIPSKDLERWKRALRWFLQCVTLECDNANRAQEPAAHQSDQGPAGNVSRRAVRAHCPRPHT